MLEKSTNLSEKFEHETPSLEQVDKLVSQLELGLVDNKNLNEYFELAKVKINLIINDEFQTPEVVGIAIAKLKDLQLAIDKSYHTSEVMVIADARDAANDPDYHQNNQKAANS